jgi:hypothetical protein
VVASDQKVTAGTIPGYGNTNVTQKTAGTKLTPAQRKRLASPQLANAFPVDARLYRSFDEAHTVFEYGEIDLYAMRDMLALDGNPRKLEQVLTLPIRSAEWEIRGKGKIPDFVRANLGDKMDKLIAQCCSAIAYRKAFFELVWKLDGENVVYDSIQMRPATSCQPAHNSFTGKVTGFRQRVAPINAIDHMGEYGWIRIPDDNAFVYIYGTHREPLLGVSDLDVSLYCWENIKKLRFLWCQFLEQQSLPKVIVYGDDPQQAVENAQMIADAAASASIPIERRIDPTQKTFEILESSGKGAAQFHDAIVYFEGQQTQSVLASFMDLAQSASHAKAGSNALSADQSEFYLASRQAVADEISEQITEGIIRPLVTYNFGPDVEIPDLHFAPIGNRQTDRALNLLMTIVTAEKPTVPETFVGFLLNQVSAQMGLDATDVADAVQEWGKERQKMMEAAEAAAAAAAEIPVPMTPPSTQQPLPGADALANQHLPIETPTKVPAKPAAGASAVSKTSNAAARRVSPNKTGTAAGKSQAPQRVAKSKLRRAQDTSMSLAVEMAAELVAAVKDGADPHDALRALRES